MNFSIDLEKKYNLFGVEVSLLTLIMTLIFLIVVYGVVTRKSESFGNYGNAGTTMYASVDNDNDSNDHDHTHDHQMAENQPTQSNIKVYNFNTSWCGHSVRFQDEWSKFMDMVNVDGESPIAEDVKCDKKDCEATQALCAKYRDHVPGFPSVLFVLDEGLENQRIVGYGNNENEGRSADMIKNKMDLLLSN